MSEWKEVKLGEILNFISKGTTPPKGVGFVDKGINYVKSDAIGYDRKLDKTKIVQINEETHQKFKRSQLTENDILFSMAGIYLGKNAIVTKDILPANTNQALAILRLNQEEANPNYVSLYLSQQSMIDFINNMSGQSAQPNVNFEEIKSIVIKLPPLPEQTAIASVLSSLDDKIDLLHRQNVTLEKIAETLFRQWFVEEAKEVWENCNLEDLCSQINPGGTPSTKIESYYNGNINWYSTKELNDNYLFESVSKITQDGLDNSSAKLFPKGTVLIAIYAAPTVGRLGILGNQASFNQAACGLVANDKICCKEFIYLFLKSQRDELNAMASGSAQQNLNVGKIKSYPSFIPDEITMTKFKKEVIPLFSKIEINSNQIRTLTNLRDTLLPKLMSREVKVY